MAANDLLAAVAALGFFGMIGLRTKMQYRQRGVTLQLTRTGWWYFGGAAGMMALGWIAAPWLAPLLGLAGHPALPVLPTVMRVAWFLATYYLFIGVHHWVRARGAAVFAPAGGSTLPET
jgi:hypothetical protein